MTPIDPSLFRALCGRFPTGVIVVTTLDAAGHPVGMTANSFTSVSLHPPLVAVNVDHRADMHRHLTVAPRFAVNILERHQEALSRRFAEDLGKRFEGVGYRRGDGGVPLLDGVLAVLECERHACFEAGDHTIVVGRVVSGVAAEGQPLLFYQGGYASLGEA